MSSFSRVDIDKLNINWDEIYTNKSDAQNNVNSITANQDYWGDNEGLSAEIYDDGTVLIYEGDTPMGWTTLEALGLDENGNQLTVHYEDLTKDDIPEGEYVACTNENGTEGYAVVVDDNLIFIPKDYVLVGQNGYMLWRYPEGDEILYVAFEEESGKCTTGLSESDLVSYARDHTYAFTNQNGITVVIQSNSIQRYTSDKQFTVGDNKYIIAEKGILQVNSDGTISVANNITLPTGDEVDASLIRGTADYNGEKVVVIGTEDSKGAAMIISADGTSNNISKTEFPDLFTKQSQ